ncbi:hypothetical protein DYE50_06790 [Treponema ruminis]|uniref:CheY-like chemotaxis protein n=1 Tax=Treponema ruminis TaxID=744515 RepID=A0A7W8G846_9SPIR|nr:hypothetical protein [Treponema ruminis]MBB5225585.1 CheY-like chemotaxis protein [Treponema ruminis]QSI02273.1 hypothetical protein DYE50_06790 [Treponema ruminis]
MKALLVADDEKAINNISEVLKAAGYDTIVYTWLLKALDNIEEIAPHLIIVSTGDYPRHWKTLAQYATAGFGDYKPQIILYTDENFSEEENKKAEALHVRGTFDSVTVDGLDKLREILKKADDIFSGYLTEEEQSEISVDDLVPNANKFVEAEIEEIQEEAPIEETEAEEITAALEEEAIEEIETEEIRDVPEEELVEEIEASPNEEPVDEIETASEISVPEAEIEDETPAEIIEEDSIEEVENEEIQESPEEELIEEIEDKPIEEVRDEEILETPVEESPEEIEDVPEDEPVEETEDDSFENLACKVEETNDENQIENNEPTLEEIQEAEEEALADEDAANRLEEMENDERAADRLEEITGDELAADKLEEIVADEKAADKLEEINENDDIPTVTDIINEPYDESESTSLPGIEELKQLLEENNFEESPNNDIIEEDSKSEELSEEENSLEAETSQLQDGENDMADEQSIDEKLAAIMNANKADQKEKAEALKLDTGATSVSFVFTNPITLAMVSGVARNYNGLVLEFTPDIPNFIMNLSPGTKIDIASMKIDDKIENVFAEVMSNDAKKLALAIKKIS